jgi:hypothetical protein
MLTNFDNHNSDIKNQIYDVYLALFKLNIKVQRKCSIMTSLLGGDEWSWRVIGITLEAVNLLERNGYKYLKGSICRAHIVGRLTTAKTVYERDEPVSLDELFQIYWANDKTVISTKAENGNHVRLPLVIPIDHELKNFPCGAVVGWKHRKQEANFLSKLHASYKAGEITLIDPYNP